MKFRTDKHFYRLINKWVLDGWWIVNINQVGLQTIIFMERGRELTKMVLFETDRDYAASKLFPAIEMDF